MRSIDAAVVTEFLQANFHNKVAEVCFIGSGMFSHAYSFTVERQAFVLRVNAYEEDFKKDAFAYQHFCTAMLPIPKVVQIGWFDDKRYFAITECCAGTTINEMDEVDVRKLVPKLFETLRAIHSVDVSGYPGWGLMDADGSGQFASWQEYLLSLYNQKFAYEYFELAQHTFLEKEVYEVFLAAMKQLLPYCPLEKYLVHGDFGFDNVMSDAHKVTGVLDWAESRLGDFVYDIAYLNFWSEHIPYGALWSKYAASVGYDISHFEERLRCYMLNIGLSGLAIAAIKEDEADYIWVRERTRSVL